MTGAGRDGAEAVALAEAILGPSARRDEPIGSRTTYRVGGNAALFFPARREADLALVAEAVAESGIAVLVLGKGSNLLVADAGFPGLCVVLEGELEALELPDGPGLLRAGGGLSYPVLARRGAAAGLRGMEWAVGIPGSVGGAVCMNAGGHGAETKDRLVSARLFALDKGEAFDVAAGALDLSYRHSALRPLEVVVSATFRVEAGARAEALAQIDEIVAWRREHQPGGRNAGSVFSNPPGDAAGRLVEAAGAKGLRIGSAEVSAKHANFIQADPGGRSGDVRALIEEVRRRVADRLGVELALELRLVGFEG